MSEPKASKACYKTTTKMHCCKPLGGRVMARMFECQVVELRVALLKRFMQLGRSTTVPVHGVAASGVLGISA